MQEAAVACRQMNCGNPLAVKYKAFFGKGQDQVWLDDVECTGHEKTLSDCPHRGFGENDCDHNEDAGIVCSGNTYFIVCFYAFFLKITFANVHLKNLVAFVNLVIGLICVLRPLPF